MPVNPYEPPKGEPLVISDNYYWPPDIDLGVKVRVLTESGSLECIVGAAGWSVLCDAWLYYMQASPGADIDLSKGYLAECIEVMH